VGGKLGLVLINADLGCNRVPVIIDECIGLNSTTEIPQESPIAQHNAITGLIWKNWRKVKAQSVRAKRRSEATNGEHPAALESKAVQEARIASRPVTLTSMEIDQKEVDELAELRFDIDQAQAKGVFGPAHFAFLKHWNEQIEQIRAEGEAEYDAFLARLRDAVAKVQERRERERENERLIALAEHVSDLYRTLYSRGAPGTYNHRLFEVAWQSRLKEVVASSSEERAGVRDSLMKAIEELSQQIRDKEEAAVRTSDINYLDTEEERASKLQVSIKNAAENGIRNADSPLRRIFRTARDGSIDWTSNVRSSTKAYILACISELVYFQMSKVELGTRDRYRVIPSAMLNALIDRNLELEIEIIMQAAEVPTAFTESGGFIFGTFRFGSFTVIGVRGTTQTLADWILDFDARKVHVNGKGYHYGFYRDAEAAVSKLILKTPADSNPVYFTGHSLGGAIAGILPDLWQGPGRLMTPYTFGSPRFGTKQVAKPSSVYAYVRALDPVPHVPLKSMGYRSSGWPPIVVPSSDHLLTDGQMLRKWKELLPAHSIEEYRKLLGEDCESQYFPPSVYLKALKTALMDYPEEGPKTD
jgi:hypothetical protein